MKIGFDAKRLFNNFTGLGNYSRTLVDNLNKFFPDNNYYLFTPKTKRTKETLPFIKAPYKMVNPVSPFKNIWRMFGSVKAIKELNLDIYHGLSHELPIGINKIKTKSVVTIHDLIYKTYPNDFNFTDRIIYNFKFNYSCKHADKIIAISESTKSDIVKLFNTKPEKIEVVYQTCNDIFKTPLNSTDITRIIKNLGLPSEFLLYVGSIIERKNLLSIIKALEILGDEISLPLVVVGKGNKYEQKVREYVHNKKLENRVFFTSNLSYSDLPALYQRAKIFIYPSFYEGFGIPLIESLWSKTPVITSDISSLPEAAGPGAFYCKPDNPETIADGITKLLSDDKYYKQLSDAGYEYVKQFEPEITATKMMRIYQDLLQS